MVGKTVHLMAREQNRERERRRVGTLLIPFQGMTLVGLKTSVTHFLKFLPQE
jgi:hypothetical protein